MSNTKVRVIGNYDHPVLQIWLPIGYKTELIPKLSTTEKVLVNSYKAPGLNGKAIVIPSLIAPIGNYEGFTFLSADGQTCSDKSIEYVLGYNWDITKVFEKL